MQFRIREYRDKKKMSQKQLSEAAGVSRAIISGLECGSIVVTTTDTLLRIAKALDAKVSEIFLE